MVCVLEALGTLVNTVQRAEAQRVWALEGDRGLTTFYPAPNNRLSSLLHTYPKF